MREWVVYGTEEVCVYVTAETREEAIEKASNGEYCGSTETLSVQYHDAKPEED